jgi:protein-S-isoprenylcysteine O-methyltransferase Ste14
MPRLDSERPVDSGWPVGRLLVRLIIVTVLFALPLFLAAGRLDWPAAWTFMITFFLFLLAYGLWGMRSDPEQLRERGHVAENVKPWDKAIMGIYTVLLVVLLVVAGLDAGRFGWSSLPLLIRILGWIGLIVPAGLISWTIRENTYLGRMARIQDDRGQQVVSTGPYRYVRHPMYIGIIVLFIGLPLALGSGWGLAPGGLIGIVFIVRTALEDHMLRQELPGYEEYAGRVRYRLLPGVW